MYAPTRHQPAAAPTRASYVRAALYHYAPAPYVRHRCKPARSMAAALAAAGYTPCAARLYMARQHARALAGKPLIWPRP